MGKLTGKKKAEFLERMAKGRKKAARGTKPAAKKTAARKTAVKGRNPQKLTGKKKTEFLERMARGRKKAKRTMKPAAKRGNGKKRRNTDGLDHAERMFETFHQRPPNQIIEYDQTYRYPENYAELGKLIELRFWLDSANPDFQLTKFQGTQAVCTPDGQNIYFIGGDMSIDFEALGIAAEKDFVELGPCTYICYRTEKGIIASNERAS